MAERPPDEQLDAVLEAMLTHSEGTLPAVNPELTGLLPLAADLRDLPAPEFRARLGAELQRRAAMQTSVRPVPVGYRTLTLCLVVRDGLRAMDWYREAFGAEEIMRFVDPERGFLAHGEIRIGSSRIALAEEAPEWHNLSPLLTGGPSASISLEVDDVDAVVAQAIAVGARLERPVQAQFYGERSGVVVDPFGHRWMVATRTEDVSPEEMQRRYEALPRRPDDE